MTLRQQLARLEQQLYEQEHHVRWGMGHLDRTYLDRQARRRDLSLALIREYEREIEALKVRLAEISREVGVVLTERGFEMTD